MTSNGEACHGANHTAWRFWAFRAAAFYEHAAAAHAHRIPGREFRNAAIVAERVGEQQLARSFRQLVSLADRLKLRDALAAAELVLLHLLRDEPGDHSLVDAVGSHLVGHLLVSRFHAYLFPRLGR